MPEKLPDYRTTIESIARTKGSVVSVFADFVKISACAVACQTREEEYLETIAKYSQEEAQQLSQAFANMVLEMEKESLNHSLKRLSPEKTKSSSHGGCLGLWD